MQLGVESTPERFRIAVEHKNALIERIAESLRAAGDTDVKKQATQWVLLLDGAVITAMREGHVCPIQEARRMAARLRDRSDASN